jgi:hypothetical protein
MRTTSNEDIEQMIDQQIAELTADDGTLSEQGKLKAEALRQQWASFKDMLNDGELKILLTIEQQRVYAEDRAEADKDDDDE